MSFVRYYLQRHDSQGNIGESLHSYSYDLEEEKDTSSGVNTSNCDPVNILAFDGGGVRGKRYISCILVLSPHKLLSHVYLLFHFPGMDIIGFLYSQIMSHLQKRIEKIFPQENKSYLDQFDLIVGVSAGAITTTYLSSTKNP